MITASFIWAATGELAVVSQATGEVVPSSKIKTVQHLEGGIVREILVREGETVKAGQPIVILESTSSTADVAEQNIQLGSLSVKIIRLSAEINSKKTLIFPDEVKKNDPTLTRRAVEIFKTRKLRLESQIKVQEALVDQYQFQIEEIKARLAGTTNVRTFIEEQVGISEKLLKHSLSNRMNHIDLLKQLADLKSQQKVDQAALKRMNSSIEESQSRLELVKNIFVEEAYDELREAQRTFDIINERIHKGEDSLRRTILRSPVDGTVKSIFIVTIGGILTPGGAVADIVPAEDRLIIEAKLPIGDIGYVQIGQKVKLRLSTSGISRLKQIEGEVINISPDSTIQNEGPPFYKIKISTDQDRFGTSKKPYHLFPGMLIQCSVITGKRTVLDYLAGPFVLYLDTAMLER